MLCSNVNRYEIFVQYLYSLLLSNVTVSLIPLGLACAVRVVLTRENMIP